MLIYDMCSKKSQLVFLDWWPALDLEQFPRREIQQIHRLLRATSMQSSTSTASENVFWAAKTATVSPRKAMNTQRNHQNTIGICPHNNIAEIVETRMLSMWSAVNSSQPRLIKAWSGDRYLQRKAGYRTRHCYCTIVDGFNISNIFLIW